MDREFEESCKIVFNDQVPEGPDYFNRIFKYLLKKEMTSVIINKHPDKFVLQIQTEEMKQKVSEEYRTLINLRSKFLEQIEKVNIGSLDNERDARIRIELQMKTEQEEKRQKEEKEKRERIANCINGANSLNKEIDFTEFCNDLYKELDNFLTKTQIDNYYMWYIIDYIYKIFMIIVDSRLVDNFPEIKGNHIVVLSPEFREKYFTTHKFEKLVEKYSLFCSLVNEIISYGSRTTFYNLKISETKTQFYRVISKVVEIYIQALEEVKKLKEIIGPKFKKSNQVSYKNYEIRISENNNYKYINVRRDEWETKIEYSYFISISIFERGREYISEIQELKQRYNYGINLYREIFS